LVVIVVVAVLAAAVGWFAGQRIKSPAELAAETEPPEASLITVPVEERELSTSVVIRGQVEFDDVAEIPVNPSAGGSTIITNVPLAVGDQLTEGAVAIEVAGRPLLVLEGQLPVFRPLAPGVEGPDVRQLEAALERLGYDPGIVDEVFDNNTEDAIGEFYRAAGYRPNEPTSDDLARLQSARDRVRSATTQLAQARAEAGAGVPESTRLSLDQQVRQAERQLADARNDRTEVLGAATAAREAAEIEERAARAAAELASARLVTAQDGTHPDTGEPVTAAELAEFEQLSTAANERFTIAIAATPVALADEAAVKLEQDRLVADAQTNLAIASASRTEALHPVGRGNLVGDAQAELADANQALTDLDAQIGISIPTNELFFLPQLPQVVQQVNVETGDTPQGSAMTVTGSGLVIRSSVSAADRPLIDEGVEGVMDDPGLGISVPVRVAFVADSPGGPNVGDGRYGVRLEPIGELPEDAIDQNLRVTVPFQSTDGPVLAVPLAALSAGADGSSRVQVERPDGTVEDVTVETGLLARAVGLVEIRAVDGDLEAGDRVVVGRDSATVDADPSGNDRSEDESE
jgi:peptidoglycan hydrolase-like protein with peptidoglycan-binding domain